MPFNQNRNFMQQMSQNNQSFRQFTQQNAQRAPAGPGRCHCEPLALRGPATDSAAAATPVPAAAGRAGPEARGAVSWQRARLVGAMGPAPAANGGAAGAPAR